MTYEPADDRYENLPYRRTGRSGLLLPAVSLGLWQNFGGVPLCNNHPLWSLSSEAYFYLIGPVLVIAALRRSPGAIAAALLLLGIGALYWTNTYSTPLFGLVLWLFGLLPWFVRVRVPAWLGLTPLAVMLVLSRGHLIPNEMLDDLLLAAAFTLSLCSVFGSGVPRLHRTGTYLASFSYSLYLVHMPLAQAFVRGTGQGLPVDSPRSYVTFAAGLALIVAVAMAFGAVFESRTHRFRGMLRRLLRA